MAEDVATEGAPAQEPAGEPAEGSGDAGDARGIPEELYQMRRDGWLTPSMFNQAVARKQRERQRERQRRRRREARGRRRAASTLSAAKIEAGLEAIRKGGTQVKWGRAALPLVHYLATQVPSFRKRLEAAGLRELEKVKPGSTQVQPVAGAEAQPVDEAEVQPADEVQAADGAEDQSPNGAEAEAPQPEASDTLARKLAGLEKARATVAANREARRQGGRRRRS